MQQTPNKVPPSPAKQEMSDTTDKLVVFLAKRDGIDKLVKTIQYISKLIHYHSSSDRAKSCELAAGLSRKAFRTGRFLAGFNALRRSPGNTPLLRALAVVANGGEMVYFLFDHLLWLSRAGVVRPALAPPASFVSAFGEAVGYVFFVAMEVVLMRKEGDLAMRVMAVAANLADFVIALAEIEPNPFCGHPVTLGISGLVSAWAGWYRNWPS